MTEITSRTVYEVDGQQFGSECDAKAYVRRKAAVGELENLLYRKSNLTHSEAEDAANAIAEHWEEIVTIMDPR